MLNEIITIYAITDDKSEGDSEALPPTAVRP
jgi:hypothetical protein